MEGCKSSVVLCTVALICYQIVAISELFISNQNLIPVWSTVLRSKARPSVQMRQGITFITADLLTTHLFCEMKVDLRYRYPSISTFKMDMGQDKEDFSLPRETMDTESLITAIQSGRTVSVKHTFYVKVGDLAFSGTPDLLIFFKGKPRILLEYKYTNHTRIFRNEVAQVMHYRFILGKMGFDCDQLQCFIFKQNHLADESKTVLDFLYGSLTRDQPLPNTTSVFREIVYDEAWISSIYQQLSIFWVSADTPRTTDNLNKCMGCEMLELCPKFNSPIPL